MKKTYKVDVDCANCANKMEEAVKNTEGVKDATLSFMTLKLKVEFEEGVDPQAVMEKAREFIYRNARPLELAQWQYHFENGSKENVYTQEYNDLQTFQN